MNSSSSSSSSALTNSTSSSDPDTPPSSSSAVRRALLLIQSDDLSLKIEAAKEIRRLTKTSQRCRRQLACAVKPLVCMLRVGDDDSVESNESALLALLNLAVKDEKNKISIVKAGALEPIISFLQSQNSILQEYATASLLTLSASTINKPVISASGAIPLLVEILRNGNAQAKADAVMALSNLSTLPDNLDIILKTNPIPSIVSLLKTCKKSSKTTEKCCGLIESLVGFDEGRIALTSEEGGILAVIEVLENGSPQSREHAVGALLTLCQGDRCKYREPILREGVIPGLLELTVQGTPKAQPKAQTLLRLLRDSPYPRSELQPDTLENIVCNIISQIDGDEQSGKAKKMLAEMVQVSMEQSLRHLQQRALVCTPTSNDLPISSSCTSEVSSNILLTSLVIMARNSNEIENQEISNMEEGLAVSTDPSASGKFDCCSSPAAPTISQKAPFYVIAQLMGSFLASGTLARVLDVTPKAYFGTVPVGSTGQSLQVGDLAGLAVGMTILLNVFVAGPISGASMNPARSIGPALVMHEFKGLWVYIVGPIIGTLAGAFAYNVIRSTDRSLGDLTKDFLDLVFLIEDKHFPSVGATFGIKIFSSNIDTDERDWREFS
ncbi:unnamed protein product, partial [Dovyalis caffra]